MSEEITLDGMGIAPGVLETIATVAAQRIEGVAGVGGTGIAGLVQKGASRGVIIEMDESGALKVAMHVHVLYGRPIRDTATDVQRAVTDALLTHTGQTISAVDVYVDGVVFPEK